MDWGWWIWALASHFRFFIEISSCWGNSSPEGFKCSSTGPHESVNCCLFFPFPFSLKMAFCLYCYFCCKCGLNSSRYAWFFWCYIKDSVAWTHLKFLPKLVFKFHHNQMINVLPDWTSPWLIVWFSRHWGREDEVKGKLRWCWLCCPILTSWMWKGEGCKCTSHSCCEGAGDFDLSKLFL